MISPSQIFSDYQRNFGICTGILSHVLSNEWQFLSNYIKNFNICLLMVTSKTFQFWKKPDNLRYPINGVNLVKTIMKQLTFAYFFAHTFCLFFSGFFFFLLSFFFLLISVIICDVNENLLDIGFSEVLNFKVMFLT